MKPHRIARQKRLNAPQFRAKHLKKAVRGNGTSKQPQEWRTRFQANSFDAVTIWDCAFLIQVCRIITYFMI